MQLIYHTSNAAAAGWCCCYGYRTRTASAGRTSRLTTEQPTVQSSVTSTSTQWRHGRLHGLSIPASSVCWPLRHHRHWSHDHPASSVRQLRSGLPGHRRAHQIYRPGRPALPHSGRVRFCRRGVWADVLSRSAVRPHWPRPSRQRSHLRQSWRLGRRSDDSQDAVNDWLLASNERSGAIRRIARNVRKKVRNKRSGRNRQNAQAEEIVASVASAGLKEYNYICFD